MAGTAFVNSNPGDFFLEHFNDVVVLRLGVKEGNYVVFGRVVISNGDADRQNACARIAVRDGADLSDKVELSLQGGNISHCFYLQGTLRVDPGKTEIIDIRCSTFQGLASQFSLFAVQVGDLRTD